jgi:predicted 2-oxoglutarate/Fe(II)-dependent dioxygenase YbiX
MSVLLSDPAGFAGGEFVTWCDNLPVAHALCKGDAVLLHSCRAHNVGQVTLGVRRSLVIEIWSGDTNVKDRFR